MKMCFIFSAQAHSVFACVVCVEDTSNGEAEKRMCLHSKGKHIVKQRK